MFSNTTLNTCKRKHTGCDKSNLRATIFSTTKILPCAVFLQILIALWMNVLNINFQLGHFSFQWHTTIDHTANSGENGHCPENKNFNQTFWKQAGLHRLHV